MIKKLSSHGPTRCLRAFAAGILAAVVGGLAHAEPLRVVVVGGIELSGVWPALAPRVTAGTGIQLETVAVGPKESILPLFRQGRADVVLIHGGDEAFALSAEGLGGALTVWGFNEHVIVGPEDDPARVGAAANAEDGMRRIARAGAPFIAFRDVGSHGIVQRLWRRAGVVPAPDWVLLDQTRDPRDVLSFAAERGAYVVIGHIPVAFGKLALQGQRVLLKGDPAMRRAYVAVGPGPRHPATVETREAAARLIVYLVSEAGQDALREADREARGPWVYPLPRPGEGRAGGGER